MHARGVVLTLAVALMVSAGVVVPSSTATAAASIDLTQRGVVHLSQNDPRWAGMTFKVPGGGDQTYGGCGCFLTVWSMVLRYEYGDPGESNGTKPWFPVFVGDPATGGTKRIWSWNPVYLHQFLQGGRATNGENVGGDGYKHGSNCGGVVKGWMFEDAGFPAFIDDGSGNPKQITGSGISMRYRSGFDTAAVEAGLRAAKPRPTPVVIRNPETGAGHMQLIVGWDDDFGGYLIVDPADSARAAGKIPGIADPDNARETQRQQYDRWRSWITATVPYEPVVEPSWFVSPTVWLADDPAPIELTLTHPDGRRTGYDPVTGREVAEVPDAWYGRDLGGWTDSSGRTPPGMPGRVIAARSATEGTYRFQVTATGTGPAEYVVGSTGADGEQTELLTVSDDVTPGETRKFELHVSASGETTAVEVEAFTADARAGNDVSGLTGVALAFDGSASTGTDAAIAEYAWDFGDGAAGSGARTTHTYDTPGVYPVTLTVTDERGGRATDTLIATVASATRTSDGKTTHRVNLTRLGKEANGGSLNDLAVSADGRFVALHSDASNLVAGDTNQTGDVFVKDLHTGGVERVSVSSNGEQYVRSAPWDRSQRPSISADGRFVAFDSPAANFAPRDTNGREDVFLRDRALATTELVSAGPDGAAMGGTRADVSRDGRYVAFSGPDGVVYRRDRADATTTAVSVSAQGARVIARGFDLSADGNVLVFSSRQANVVPGVSSIWDQVYARDIRAGTTELVSATPSGGPGGHYSFFPSVSADGRYVAFETQSSNQVPGSDANGWLDDILVRDRVARTTERVNLSTGGVQGNHHARQARISDDGRYVAFESRATNLVPGDTNATSMSNGDDVFVRDRDARTLERVTVSTAGDELPVGAYASVGAVSGDGSAVVFSASASLSPGLGGGLFVRHRLDPQPIGALGGPYVGWADSAESPAAVRFDASGSYDLHGKRLTASWDFGDGTTSTDALTTSHRYAQPGTYDVSVTVSNGTSASERITTTVTVLPHLPSDTTDVTPACTDPGGTLSVRGFSRSSNAALVANGHDLSHGPPQPAAVPVRVRDHVVASPVARMPDLLAEASVALGNLRAGTHEVRVGAAPQTTIALPCPDGNHVPIADAGGPYTAWVGDAVVFDGSQSLDADGDALTYEWRFGDGAIGTGVAPTHVFQRPGTYIAQLVVSDDTLTSSGTPGDRSFAVVSVNVRPTVLEAAPAVAEVLPGAAVHFPELRATLRTAATPSAPLGGRTIRFLVDGAEVCSAVTGADGVATCGDTTTGLDAVLARGYRAEFAGDEAYAGSTADGPLVRVAGQSL